MKEYFLGEGSKSYPKFKQIKSNSYYCGLLQNLYSGPDSEMASFMQLSYQSFILSPFGNENSKIFSAMAEEELLHAKSLAEAIIMMGGDPVFCSAQGVWLGGRSVDYVKSLKQMLNYNIESKEKSVIDYKTVITKIDEPQIKNLLKSILSEEEEHLYKLKAVYRSMQ